MTCAQKKSVNGGASSITKRVRANVSISLAKLHSRCPQRLESEHLLWLPVNPHLAGESGTHGLTHERHGIRSLCISVADAGYVVSYAVFNRAIRHAGDAERL